MKIIAHADKNWGIGKNNGLMFNLPQDMKFFRETTKGAAIIMGRKTLDSFPGGRPLKDRINIVLTNNQDFNRDDVIVCHTKEALLAEAAKYPLVFVIGGATVYHMLLNECDEALITKVDAAGDADAFLDNLDALPKWHLESESDIVADNGYLIKFCKYINTKVEHK